MSRAALIALASSAVSVGLMGCGGGGAAAEAKCAEFAGAEISAIACTGLVLVEDCECEKAFREIAIKKQYSECDSTTEESEAKVTEKCGACQKEVLNDFTNDSACDTTTTLRDLSCQCQDTGKIVNHLYEQLASCAGTKYLTDAQARETEDCGACHAKVFDLAWPYVEKGCSASEQSYGYPCDCHYAFHNWNSFNTAACDDADFLSKARNHYDSTCGVCLQRVVEQEEKFKDCTTKDCANYCQIVNDNWPTIMGWGTNGGDCESNDKFTHFYEDYRDNRVEACKTRMASTLV